MREIIIILTLFNYLMVTFGYPLPTPNHIKPTGNSQYPCQKRPCGCRTSEQCWTGDCCCFTLEEKLAWAEENGVEPPQHVRPLVEFRKSRLTRSQKKSCCSEIKPVQELSASSTCCEKQTPPTCCSEKSMICEMTPDAECPHCAAQTNPNCPQNDASQSDNKSNVRWVLGIFAQKCRGEGLPGIFQLDPVTVPYLNSSQRPETGLSEFIIPSSDSLSTLTHSPPSPPPRSY